MATSPVTRRPFLLLAMLLLAVPPVLAAGPARAATTTTVSLTFDDANADQYGVRSVLADHDMNGTFFVNTGRIDNGGLSLAQVRDLAADGNEIAGHTIHHTDLTTLDPDEAARQVCNDRVNLFEWGFEPTDFAYPYGHTDAQVERIVADCGYNSARQIGDIRSPEGCGGCAWAETVPPQDPYSTRAPSSVTNSWSLADIQCMITGAENHGGGWLQLTFHHICDGCATAYTITPANFEALLDWLQPRAARGTVVRTVRQVIGGPVRPATPGPVAPAGRPLGNPSLERDDDADNLPDCWQLGASGSNTATWTRTGDAHTGGFAERVQISAWSSGDRKLVTAQDLGPCAPSVVAGNRQALSVWYKATAPTRLVAFYRNAVGSWKYWTSGPTVAASAGWAQATWTTPAVPSGYSAISFGLALAAVGSLTTDDYAMTDVGTAPSPVTTARRQPFPRTGRQRRQPARLLAARGERQQRRHLDEDRRRPHRRLRRAGRRHGLGRRRPQAGDQAGRRHVLAGGHRGARLPGQRLVQELDHGPDGGVLPERGRDVGVLGDRPGGARVAGLGKATWTTPAVPAGATALSFGLALAAVGSLTTDDYDLAEI